MHSDAATLVSNHQLTQAKAKYAELSDFLASRTDDPELNKLAGEVKQDLARLDRPAAQKATAPVPAAPPPASAPTVVHVDPSPAPRPAANSVASAQQIAPVPVPPPAEHHPVVEHPAPAGRPPVHTVADTSGDLTDAQIGASIQKGVDFLIGEFDPKTFELRDGAQGRGKRAMRDGYHDGADVLCVYALMQCGEALPNDTRLSLHGPFLPGCFDAMKALPLEDRFGTYSRGLRATALAHNNRKEDFKVLKADVTSLLKTVNKGAYTYFNDAPNAIREGNWDNSNSQYGLLGVWSGAETEIEIPKSYWIDVEKHWTSCQAPNGEWCYHQQGDPRLTMTCAGIASMFVCHDWIDAPLFGTAVGREPFSPPLKKGLDWLEQGDHSVDIQGQWGYCLYGVERVGLASGFKFFGKHNWYPELARQILRRQSPNGSWGNTVDTAYALLFLSRGRHPVLMNKLRYDGFWANRPRDVANLAKYASHEMEKPLNWQVVPISAQWTDWTDSPILYIGSHIPPKLSNDDVDKIRQFVLAGGMLFVQADGDARVMAPFAAELGHRLFPQYEMKDVPPGHPLFNSVYKLTTHPPLRMVSNGARILMLFSPTDISRRWQLREQKGQAGKPIYQLGLNMFIYAAGRRDLRNRLDTNNLGPVVGASSMTVKIARVQYAGPWDPEPYAWTRFSRWFHKQTGYGLDVQAVPMRELNAATYPFAHLTGTAAYRATADEVAAVKKYVEDGGVLLIDLTGGKGAFDESIRSSLLFAAFPSANPLLLQPYHPLLQASGSGMEDLSRSKLRPYAIEKIGASGGTIDYFKAGKGHVIFTSLDITSGLLNTGTWGILGYEPGYAQSLLKNAIFWTLDGQKD